MTTLFPGAYDDFLNPTSGTQLSAVGYKHHQHHTDLNDAVEAIEHALGTSTGAVVSGVFYSLTSLSGQITTISGSISTLSGVVTTGMQVLSSVTTTVSGLVVTVSGLATTVSGTSSGAPTDAQYLTLATHTGLTVERTLAISGTLSGTDNGANSTFVVRDLVTGITSGTYYKPTITVNSYGKLTFAGDSGANDGFFRGIPTSPRTLASMGFGEYVSTYDKVYLMAKTLSGGLYYIDRQSDYHSLIATISGKTPGTWIYSTILTGFLVSNATSATGFVCTITGGSIVGAPVGLDGGACIRTSVSGKTIYANGTGGAQITIYDPASNTATNTLASGAGGTDGRSIVYVSGVDCVYQARRDSDVFKVFCTTTGTATISGVGLNLGSRCSAAYNLNANRVFFCGANTAATKTWYFTPTTGTETISTLNFPALPNIAGCYAAYSVGNYVYFVVDCTPAMVLVLDAVNLTWKFPLNEAESSTSMSFDHPSFLAAVPAEGVMYLGVSVSVNVGYVSWGRVG